MEGLLKVWKEDKGFGFISSAESKDIFIHISALKNMSRRPVVGDKITFELHTDNTGKVRAINAQIQGVTRFKTPPQRQAYKKQSPKKSLSIISIVVILLVSIVGIQAYEKLTVPKAQAHSISTVQPVVSESSKPVVSNFSCSGKVYCSEMTSCSEAKYYLNHCPNTKMDGDSDGIPCEKQWCNSFF